MSESLTQETIAVQPDWDATAETIRGLAIDENLHARADQIALIDGPGMMRVAVALHEQLAPGVSHEPTDYPMHLNDRQGERTKTFMTPDKRPAFYDTAAQLIDNLAQQREDASDDQAFLNRAANIVNLAVVLAHPFEDGNGRTSRVMGQLIREGFDGSQQAIDDLRYAGQGREGRSGRLPLATRPINAGVALGEAQLLAIAASSDIPLSDTAAYAARKQQHFDNTWSES